MSCVIKVSFDCSRQPRRQFGWSGEQRGIEISANKGERWAWAAARDLPTPLGVKERTERDNSFQNDYSRRL